MHLSIDTPIDRSIHVFSTHLSPVSSDEIFHSPLELVLEGGDDVIGAEPLDGGLSAVERVGAITRVDGHRDRGALQEEKQVTETLREKQKKKKEKAP